MAIVYQHRRLDTNEIFYIGIGEDKRRAYSKKNRNPHWHHIVEKCGYIIEISFTGVSWETACKIEKEYIKHIGRKDLGLGPLVNMTDGGDGIENASEEMRKKLSESKKGEKNPMKNPEIRKKVSEALKGRQALNKGKKISEEQRKKMSESLKGRSVWNKGIKCNEQTIKKISKTKRKKIIQLNKNTNEIIKIWDGIIDAQIELQIRHISEVCNGKAKTAGGFKWKYYEA